MELVGWGGWGLYLTLNWVLDMGLRVFDAELF